MDRLSLSYVWNQKSVPVVLRRTGRGEKLRVRLPFSDGNRHWLQNGRRTAPEWIGEPDSYWELPKSWFNDFVDRAMQRHGKVYIIQPYREQEICARACQEAQGHECQCSCMGANYGGGNDGSWFVTIRRRPRTGVRAQGVGLGALGLPGRGDHFFASWSKRSTILSILASLGSKDAPDQLTMSSCCSWSGSARASRNAS